MFNIFNFFKKIKPSGTGALIDDRPEEKKLKDYFFDETVASAAPVRWKEKRSRDWRIFSVKDQDGSGSCVMQTISKQAEILHFLRSEEIIKFSAGFYKYRKNAPAYGMNGVDAYDIWRKKGIPSEDMLPSERKNDTQMDSANHSNFALENARNYRVNGYLQFSPGIVDVNAFEKVASTIQVTGKGVMLFIFYNRNEMGDIPVVKDKNLTIGKGYRHSITAVDFTEYRGKKYLVCENSWGKNSRKFGHRFLMSEDFFKKRNYFACYPMSFKFLEEEVPEIEKKQFTKTLRYSSAITTDVTHLQDILKKEGFFPTNVASTGRYLAITARAVLAFQRKYRVASEAELASLAGRVVGPKTREALNQIHG